MPQQRQPISHHSRKKTTPLPGSGTYRLIEGSEVQELAAAHRRAAKADPGLAVRNQAQPRLLCSSAAAAHGALP